MRISDWSSDVCSSDLCSHVPRRPALVEGKRLVSPTMAGSCSALSNQRLSGALVQRGSDVSLDKGAAERRIFAWCGYRSEERRVGKEGVSTCRFRWSRYHLKKTYIKLTRALEQM